MDVSNFGSQQKSTIFMGRHGMQAATNIIKTLPTFQSLLNTNQKETLLSQHHHH